MLGRKFSKEHRRKLGDAQRGPLHHNWKGGYDDGEWRHSWEYKTWCRAVKYRDRWTCQLCDSRNDIVAHHVYDVQLFPNLKYEVWNGKALCEDCHYIVHYGHPRIQGADAPIGLRLGDNYMEKHNDYST